VLTDERLAEIEARCNAATPGPWKNVGGYCDVCASDREKEANRQANAEFVVHARADVPDLLAEVRMLRALVGEPAPTVRWADSTEWRESDGTGD